MKKIIFSIAIVLMSILGNAQNNSPITVFVAQKIITMTPAWPEGTTIAVQDGKILSVGRDMKDIEPWIKGKKYAVDETFKDKVIIPGLIESHGHPILGGIEYSLPLIGHLPMSQPYGVDFPGVKDAQEAFALLKKYVENAKDPNKPIVAFGWDMVVNKLALDKHVLDKISTTVPVCVWDASAHQCFVNSAFIKKQNLSVEKLGKLPGTGVGKDGQLNGKFEAIASAAVVLLPTVADLVKPENSEPRLQAILDMSIRGGITTQSELMMGGLDLPTEIQVYRNIIDSPDFKTRLVAVTDAEHVLEHNDNDVNKAITFIKQLEASSNDKLAFRGVKFFADDAFISQQMVMTNPKYTDGHTGIWNTAPDKLTEAFWPWWNADMNIFVHTNGTGGGDAVIKAVGELQAKKFRLDHRFAPQHLGMQRAEFARKMKTLGMMASVNPYYIYYRGEFNIEGMGADRALTALQLKTMVDEGVAVALHSDSPMGPPKPLEWAWIAVNRPSIESKNILAPAERVTAYQALKMVTVDAAYHLGMEDKIGSLEAGKFADFTVLDENPLTVEPMRIKDIKIWGTVLGGRKQAIADIVPQKKVKYMDYSELLKNLVLPAKDWNEIQKAARTAAIQSIMPTDDFAHPHQQGESCGGACSLAQLFKGHEKEIKELIASKK